ncbi:MAG: ABC transporter permease [Rhodospirillaceae bacterium]|nr:ABC transporter permease [Rhodospirillaceae bacterium]
MGRRRHDRGALVSAARPSHAGPLALGVLPLAFLGLLFLYPLLRLLLTSVADGSFAPYERALGDSLYLGVLIDTVRLALIVAAICLVLAYPVAHFLATARQPWRGIGFACLLLPFWTSMLVRTYAWMIILGRNGLVNQALLAAGVVSEPVPLLYNETGVVIGMVHVLLPYAVFPLYAVMRRIDGDLVLAAEGLGASPWRVFTRVRLPLTLPGAFAGAVLVFVIALGFFITPALLGGGRVMTLGLLIEQQVRQFLDWPFAAALAALLVLAAVLVQGTLQRLLRGGAQWH